jgi:flagellar biosynthesis protein FlhA
VIPGLPKLPFLLIGATVLLIAQRIKDPGTVAAGKPAAEIERPAPDSPSSCSARCASTRWNWPSRRTWSTWSTPTAATCWTGSGPCAARWPSNWHGHATRAYPGRPGPAALLVCDPDQRVDAGTGQAPPGTVLAIGDGLQALPGRAGVEPVFGLAGKWVPAELHYQAELSGATVVDRASVIITHLAEIVRSNASRLLGREDVRR